ncbi:type II toxin-antitoxin system VapC family toxin [Georgenia muralis]
MRRLFLDTSVLLLAVGGDHPERSTCRDIVTAIHAGQIDAHASVEAVQEYVHHRRRRSARTAVQEAVSLRRMLTLHAFDEDVLDDALTLMATSAVRGRDAVHAATALRHRFDEIVSADRDFDNVQGLTRVDPAEALGEP